MLQWPIFFKSTIVFDYVADQHREKENKRRGKMSANGGRERARYIFQIYVVSQPTAKHTLNLD